MICTARLKAWSKPDGEFSCRLPADGHDEHVATGLYEHQTISWFDADRRQFTGEFHACDQSTCILPAGHHREPRGMIRFLAAWFGLSVVAAPVVGRFLAAADVTRHSCGGTLLFVREADGHSYESCSGCGWRYDFDKGRASDAAAPIRLAPAPGETTARVGA